MPTEILELPVETPEDQVAREGVQAFETEQQQVSQNGHSSEAGEPFNVDTAGQEPEQEAAPHKVTQGEVEASLTYSQHSELPANEVAALRELRGKLQQEHVPESNVGGIVVPAYNRYKVALPDGEGGEVEEIIPESLARRLKSFAKEQDLIEQKAQTEQPVELLEGYEPPKIIGAYSSLGNKHTYTVDENGKKEVISRARYEDEFLNGQAKSRPEAESEAEVNPRSQEISSLVHDMAKRFAESDDDNHDIELDKQQQARIKELLLEQYQTEDENDPRVKKALAEIDEAEDQLIEAYGGQTPAQAEFDASGWIPDAEPVDWPAVVSGDDVELIEFTPEDNDDSDGTDGSTSTENDPAQGSTDASEAEASQAENEAGNSEGSDGGSEESSSRPSLRNILRSKPNKRDIKAWLFSRPAVFAAREQRDREPWSRKRKAIFAVGGLALAAGAVWLAHKGVSARGSGNGATEAATQPKGGSGTSDQAANMLRGNSPSGNRGSGNLNEIISNRAGEISEVNGARPWSRAYELYGDQATPKLMRAVEKLQGQGVDAQWHGNPLTDTNAYISIDGVSDTDYVWDRLSQALAEQQARDFLEAAGQAA